MLSLHAAATQTLQVLQAGPQVPEWGSLTGLRQAALDGGTHRRSQIIPAVFSVCGYLQHKRV